MRRWLRMLGFLLALVLLAAQVGTAAGARNSVGDYLVGFAKGNAEQLRAAGVRVDRVWPGINAAKVRASARALEALVQNGVLEYYEVDARRYAMGYTDGTYTWGLQAVKAPEAWSLGATGTAIKVCVLDTGIDYGHPEFTRADGTSVIAGSANFVGDGHPDATDGNGHGTHVAGTIVGQLNASGSYIGVAPDIELYVGRVLGDDGSGSSSGVIDGVNWCTDTVQAHIISMSLGSSFKSKTEERAYDAAYNKGVLPIAAAGNNGDRSTSYPAGYKNVVSVAAVDSNLQRASFSQYNRDVELAGPGVSVLSAVPRGTGIRSTMSEDGVTYPSNGVEFSPLGSVTGQLVECGLGDSTTSCGTPPTTTWIALIDRGSITFAEKVTNVMAQGASAAIIVNNDTASPDDPGSFTLGEPGDWIPTVSISYNSGVAIRSDGLGSGTVALESWDYAYYNGTSMATPHASAVAALAWSANTALTNADIRTILQNTALDLGAAGRDNEYGYGLVQADAAVTAAVNTTPGSGGGDDGGGGGGGGPPPGKGPNK